MNWLIAALIAVAAAIFAFLVGGGGILLLAVVNYEKFEKLLARLYKLASSLPNLFRGAHKQYVKHDLQARVNDFAKKAKRGCAISG